MNRLLSDRRPSPALVIACLALFVSLGGVSYGVATGSIDSREIKNSTIRTQDIRTNGVRTADVAANTLTGADIDEAKLGRVPSAGRADVATRADNATTVAGLAPSSFARTAQEAPRTLDTPGQPQFEGSFQHSAISCTDCPPVAFWKDTLGVVHLEGSFTGGLNGTVFNLPAGYRPEFGVRVLVSADLSAKDTSIVRVKSDGDVTITNGPMNNDTSLDGITFRAAK